MFLINVIYNMNYCLLIMNTVIICGFYFVFHAKTTFKNFKHVH